MAHIIILINESADCAETKIAALQNYANTLDANLSTYDKPLADRAHELLEQIQEMFVALCTGASLADCQSLDSMIAEAESILGV